MKNLEVLAPAGSYDSMLAAVRCGANAIYLGGQKFSARTNARNFNYEELKSTVKYCHERKIKVYVTVNTVIFDNEILNVMEFIKYLASLPVDAVIVQDFGLASLIKKYAKDLPIHASTQMSVHTASGAKALYEAGFSRVVLARELSKNEIKEIKKSCPVELEVFVHGALCMSVSGQCYFSSILGGRSGNRGSCAQPCRLPFSAGEKNCHSLSLKDLSIIENLNELEKMGVTSAKIEGRMKRPEYVAAAVTACRQVLDKGYADKDLFKDLENIFSRSGFTDGYYTEKRGKSMFGFRKKENVIAATNKVFAKMHKLYKGENSVVPVDFNIYISENKPLVLTANDDEDNFFTAELESPEKTEGTALTREKCEASLRKTGGTQFFCRTLNCQIDEGVTVPASSLNRLRRETLAGLAEVIGNKGRIDVKGFDNFNVAPHICNKKLKLRARVPHTKIPEEFSKYEIVYIPLSAPMSEYERLLRNEINVLPEIPRAMFSRENFIKQKLNEIKTFGINEVWAGNIGAVYMALNQGFKVHGGFSLNVTNTFALEAMQKAGLSDVELSFETSFDKIKKMGSGIKRGIIGYGYLPLMLTRNCPYRSISNTCDGCSGMRFLTDRKGIKFPCVCDGNCTEILNSVPLNIMDKCQEIKGIDFMVLRFTVENLVENVEKVYSFNSLTNRKNGFTRGLYNKTVD